MSLTIETIRTEIEKLKAIIKKKKEEEELEEQLALVDELALLRKEHENENENRNKRTKVVASSVEVSHSVVSSSSSSSAPLVEQETSLTTTAGASTNNESTISTSSLSNEARVNTLTTISASIPKPKNSLLGFVSRMTEEEFQKKAAEEAAKVTSEKQAPSHSARKVSERPIQQTTTKPGTNHGERLVDKKRFNTVVTHNSKLSEDDKRCLVLDNDRLTVEDIFQRGESLPITVICLIHLRQLLREPFQF